MIISRLKNNNEIYYALHAEQSITDTFFEDSDKGIYSDFLSKSTLERISEDYKSYSDSILIMDFERISNVQENTKDKIAELKRSSKILVFQNISTSIVKTLGIDIINNPNNKLINNDIYKFFIVSDTHTIEPVQTAEIFLIKFKEYLKKHSINPEMYFEKKNGDSNVIKLIPHFSSSVYITKYIDVKKMISDDKEFFTYCLYILAIKVSMQWLNEKPTLICQNLNGSYITSILSSFLKLDTLIFDKLGPINKIYSTLDKKIEENKKYIIVSDVVALGTEMKIAKSLITFLGGEYLGNISLIRIETISPELKTYSNTSCVYSITKSDNPIDYQIYTALNH
jgi:hypothetical protein